MNYTSKKVDKIFFNLVKNSHKYSGLLETYSIFY